MKRGRDDLYESREYKKRKFEDAPDYVIKSPHDIQAKYWKQRHHIFERFDEGIWIDEEGLYTCAHEEIAKHISKRMTSVYDDDKQITVVEGMCGNGGNLVQFALNDKIKKIYAVDINKRKMELARHNCKVYDCDMDKIEFICSDLFDLLKSNFFVEKRIDAAFLSPPWGGPGYSTLDEFTLDMIQFSNGENGATLLKLVRNKLTPNIGYCLPKNITKDDILTLLEVNEVAEIERNFFNDREKTKTVYFNKLVIEEEY